MELAVVGHGKRLFGSGLGPEIDAFKHVCHVNRGRKDAPPEDSGSRLDIIADKLDHADDWVEKDITQFWGVGHIAMRLGGWENRERLRNYVRQIPSGKIAIPYRSLKYWEAIYREIRFPTKAKTYSNGVGALICGLDHGASEIRLYGFDSVEAGGAINPDAGGDYANHDWSAESEMIPLLREYYNADIQFAGAAA